MDWYRTMPQKKFQDSSHSRERHRKVFWGMNGVILVKIMEKRITLNLEIGYYPSKTPLVH